MSRLRFKVASVWSLTQAVSEVRAQGGALSELGGGEVGRYSTMALGAWSTPQSYKVIRAHFTDKETEAQQTHAGHSRSQNKLMEKQDWDPGIQSSSFSPKPQAKLPTLQLKGFTPQFPYRWGRDHRPLPGEGQDQA